MYTVRVKPAPRQGASYAAVASGAAPVDAAGASSSSGQPSPLGTPPSAGALATAAAEELVDHVSFSAGNPRVEHVVGRVHLYRHLPPPGAQQPPAAQGGSQRQHDGAETGSWGGQPEPAASADMASPTAAGSGAHVHLPPGRNAQLCILALPADMGFAELCTFMGAYFQHVREVRLVRREGRSSVCLVLLRFASQQPADDFFRDFNGRAFCSLEPELLCRLVFVKEVDCQLAPDGAAPAPGADAPGAAAAQQQQQQQPAGARAPPGTTELPTCPVCLERLDEHISGIVTTVCNHRFHNECLRRWGDTSCPVCRYCQHSGATTSHCAVCASSADLWICLICGHVGCGRYRGSHAAGHWQASGHGYALELETQRVWDYVNDSYVHRLVQSKTDGKLVEVPSPAQRGGQAGCSGRPASRGADGASECGGGEHCYPADPEMEEALVLSKLDALAVEYNHLLVTQLESQRQYFEGLLVRRAADAEAEVEAAAAAAAAAAGEAAAARCAAAEAERRRRGAEASLAEARAALAAAEEDRQFLRQLSDSLLANQRDFQARLKAAEAAAAEKDATISELQEQVRDLMVFLEARQAIEAAGAAGELEGGTVLPVPAAAPAARRGAAGRRARQR